MNNELEEKKGRRKPKKKKKKGDRCIRIAKRKYDVWPSAYASGAVVKCRKGKIWKGLSEEQINEIIDEEVEKSLEEGVFKNLALAALAAGALSSSPTKATTDKPAQASKIQQSANVIKIDGQDHIRDPDYINRVYEVASRFGDITEDEYVLSQIELLNKNNPGKFFMIEPVKNGEMQRAKIKARDLKPGEKVHRLNMQVDVEDQLKSFFEENPLWQNEWSVKYYPNMSTPTHIIYKKKSLEEKKKPDFKKEKESGLHGWFSRQGGKGKSKGWVDCNTCRKDKKTGKKTCKTCGRKEGEKRAKYPSCRPKPSDCGSSGKGKEWGKKSAKKESLQLDEQLLEYFLEALKKDEI